MMALTHAAASSTDTKSTSSVRTAGEACPGAARRERATMGAGGAYAGLHLVCRDREAHDGGVTAFDDRRVVAVQRELERLSPHAIGRELRAQVVDEQWHGHHLDPQ